MKFRSAIVPILGSLITLPGSSQAAVIINEIDYDNIGLDNAEFIELYNIGLAAVDISGYVVALINGGTNQFYLPITIIPAGTVLAAGGFYVIGSSNIPTRNQTFPADSNQIQNGPTDAVGLYSGGSFAAGDPSTTNIDLLLDGILYEGFEDPVNYPGFKALPPSLGDSNVLNYSIGIDSQGNLNLLSAPTPGAENAAAVPEPSSAALFGTMAALVLLRRRR